MLRWFRLATNEVAFNFDIGLVTALILGFIFLLEEDIFPTGPGVRCVTGYLVL